MTIRDEPTTSRRRRLVALLLVAATVTVACSGGDDDDRSTPTTEEDGPNVGPLPTLAGGLELAPVDPVRVLAGDGLVYGQALPSEQVAAAVFEEDPEVTAVLTRRIHSLRDGRRVGDVLVLSLDGSELFDQGVLDAFLAGVVGVLGGGDPTGEERLGRPTVRAEGDSGTAIGYVEGDLLVVVRGPDDHDVGVVVERQLTALAAGTPGAAEPQTPIVAVPIDAAFVEVPTVTFATIPPPEEEPAPEPPTLPGATGVQGRYGVVAGERRTTVWAYTLDPATYPWGEAVEAALARLVAERAGGAPAEGVEVVDRLVQRATGPAEGTSARAFRHQGLALLVEGPDPAQLDAVVSAWITALR